MLVAKLEATPLHGPIERRMLGADKGVRFDHDSAADDVTVLIRQIGRHARTVDKGVGGREQTRAGCQHCVVPNFEAAAADDAHVAGDVHIAT